MNGILLAISLTNIVFADDPDTSVSSEDSVESTETSSSTGQPSEVKKTETQTSTDSVPSPQEQSEDTEGAIENNVIEDTESEQSTEELQTEDGTSHSEVEDSIEDTTEIEQMMSEIMEEMAESEADEFQLDLTVDVDEESDEEINYKGNIEYSYVLTVWESPKRNVFHVFQVSGDPQYYFQKTEDWGYTVGIRLQATSSDTLSQRYGHGILGMTGGLQYTAFRINTSVSWMWDQYFSQTRIDKADGFVTYQYDELVSMDAVLWENTLTYSPDNMDFGIQTSVGFPFQVTGGRNMGQAFKDSWQVSTRLSMSLFQLGYTRLTYPGHSIDRVQIGMGILL